MRTFYLVKVNGCPDADWKLEDTHETPYGFEVACWVNCSGGRCTQSRLDEVVRSDSADEFEDLDWSHLTKGFDDDWSSGWLDRMGNFTPCLSWQHDEVANRIFDMDPSAMEMRGWVRLWGVGQSPAFSNEKRLSAEQRNWMSRKGFNLEGYD